METDLITAGIAAKILRKSPRTIVRWAESGQIEAVSKIPGRTGAYLFRRSDIEDVRDKMVAELLGEDAATEAAS